MNACERHVDIAPYDLRQASVASRASVRVQHADPLLRVGLHQLLVNAGEWQVCDPAAPVSPPAAILADYASALEHLRTAGTAVPVLVVTSLEREMEIQKALDAGVRGYVLQSCSVEELLLAVRQLLAGRPYLGEALRGRLVSSCARISLTRRETDVLKLLGEGNCNKRIARELGIGLGTVKTHVKSLMSKLGVNARTQAVVLAAQRGLITPGKEPTPRTGGTPVRSAAATA